MPAVRSPLLEFLSGVRVIEITVRTRMLSCLHRFVASGQYRKVGFDSRHEVVSCDVRQRGPFGEKPGGHYNDGEILQALFVGLKDNLA